MLGVSVIVPCFNAEAYLRGCLQSALAQTHDGHVEVIVADDGSTDESRQIAASYSPRVRAVRHPDGGNHGVAAARNLALRSAQHPITTFLDADDEWLPGHLSSLVGALERRPATSMAFDDGYYLSPTGNAGGERRAPIDATPESLLLDCCLSPSGVAVRREVFNRIGYFDESLRYCEDHDLWLRIIERSPAVHVPAFGYLYRQHPQQLTKSPVLWDCAEIVRQKAAARYPYDGRTLRRRQAVIAYRQGACALARREYVRGACHWAAAAACDPLRTAGELARRLSGRRTR
jgi:glycosyltransferase involved in cell wall biosynthesis